MSLGCGLSARCMAAAPTAWTGPAQGCKIQVVRLFKSRPKRTLLQPRYLSTTAHRCLPRRKSQYRDWPSFRAVSKQDRLVQEYNLFDPYEPAINHAARLPAPPGNAKNWTTLPYSATPTATLEQELLYRATRNPPSRTVLNLIEYLILERGVAPNAGLYEALILNNADPQSGSADNLRSIMAEMNDIHIPFDVNLYTAILKSLVVHPDIELLDLVIEGCNATWIELDQEMLSLICAIYTRLGMIELAEDYLDRIEGKDKTTRMSSEPMDPSKNTVWLYVLLLRTLALKGDWNGVMRICYRLQDDTSLGIPLAMRQIDVPYEFWSWLLAIATDAGDVWTCDWIWKLWVRRAYITPDTRLCARLLTMFESEGYKDHIEDAKYILRSHNTLQQVVAENQQIINDLVSSKTLYVGGLSWFNRDESLRPLFEQFGEVTEVREKRKKRGQDRGQAYAWVSFAREEDARRAYEAQDQLLVNDQPVKIEYSRSDRIAAAAKLNISQAEIKHPISLREQYSHPFLLDPWAVLTKETDIGTAWPRVMRERQLEEERKRNTIARREIVEAEKKKEQVILAARETFPRGVLQDIEAAANVHSSTRFTNSEIQPDRLLENGSDVDIHQPFVLQTFGREDSSDVDQNLEDYTSEIDSTSAFR